MPFTQKDSSFIFSSYRGKTSFPKGEDGVMNLDLKGKVVMITGGSKGIGLACARAFLAEGGRVAIVSRSAANLDTAMQNLAAPKEDLIAVSCDLTARAAATAMAAEVERRLGPVDVLVNSAGAAKRYLP
jgi:NAD(P)-dependent dehydrogenase (short-subunit alcohol dehydrogenase family)